MCACLHPLMREMTGTAAIPAVAIRHPMGYGAVVLELEEKIRYGPVQESQVRRIPPDLASAV